MVTRALGATGQKVSALGLGCMGMSEFYGPADQQEALSTIHYALDCGLNFLDTADIYGMGNNEILLGRALKGRRDQAFLATKFGIVRDQAGKFVGENGRPDYVWQACEASLRRLGVSVIDLYYQHRVDSLVPIEETVGAMAQLVEQGKVRYLGLSEANPSTLRRAHAVHPIAALQTEYSLSFGSSLAITHPSRLGSSPHLSPALPPFLWPPLRMNQVWLFVLGVSQTLCEWGWRLVFRCTLS